MTPAERELVDRVRRLADHTLIDNVRVIRDGIGIFVDLTSDQSHRRVLSIYWRTRIDEGGTVFVDEDVVVSTPYLVSFVNERLRPAMVLDDLARV